MAPDVSIFNVNEMAFSFFGAKGYICHWHSYNSNSHYSKDFCHIKGLKDFVLFSVLQPTPPTTNSVQRWEVTWEILFRFFSIHFQDPVSNRHHVPVTTAVCYPKYGVFTPLQSGYSYYAQKSHTLPTSAYYFPSWEQSFHYLPSYLSSSYLSFTCHIRQRF